MLNTKLYIHTNIHHSLANENLRGGSGLREAYGSEKLMLRALYAGVGKTIAGAQTVADLVWPRHYTDRMPIIRSGIYEKWRERWREPHRDLNTNKPLPGKWYQQRAHRQEEVIINRLMLGHTRATRGYLSYGIEARQPPCR